MSFAGALLGTSGALRRAYKPAVGEIFGSQFTAVIVTETSTLQPYGKFTGQLAIDLGWPVTHNGVRIQLEAQCALKFETKLDNRVSFHKKYDNLLEGTGEMEPYSTYLESPVRTDVLPVKIHPDQYEMPVGNNRYRFNLQATGEFLPAPFKTRYGSLVYKLVVYMLHRDQWIQIGAQVLRFGGYYNLSQNLEALNPIQIERSFKKSIFSSKRIVIVTLHLESCGYLPDDEVPFTLHVSNPKCLPIKMCISLSQRIVYNVDGAKKATSAVLDSAMKEISEPGTESVWSDALRVHTATSPSYCIHPMYTVSHLLQFKVNVEDYGVVKGDVPIFIGSTREPVELLMMSTNSLHVFDNRFPARRRSTSSIHSECSGFSNSTLPPAYSQLSSRIPSLETLPPPYASEYDEDFQSLKYGNRKLSGLEFHVLPPEDDTSGNDSHSQHDTTAATTPTTTVDEDD